MRTNKANSLLIKTRTYVTLFLRARSVDAFLASYPKSGRTWFRFVLANYFAILAGVDTELALHAMFEYLPNFDLDPGRGLPVRDSAGLAWLPLVAVTHKRYQRMLFQGRPVIFMVRDPRDLLVSAYFHETRHKQRFDGSMDQFLVDNGRGLPALQRYLNAWGAQLERHPHLVLSYETLSSDAFKATTDVLAFLGEREDASALRTAISRSRFDVMQGRERVEGIRGHSYDLGDDQSLRMRNGKVGAFTEHLSASQVTMIETSLRTGLNQGAKALVAKTGLDLG